MYSSSYCAQNLLFFFFFCFFLLAGLSKADQTGRVLSLFWSLAAVHFPRSPIDALDTTRHGDGRTPYFVGAYVCVHEVPILKAPGSRAPIPYRLKSGNRLHRYFLSTALELLHFQHQRVIRHTMQDMRVL